MYRVEWVSSPMNYRYPAPRRDNARNDDALTDVVVLPGQSSSSSSSIGGHVSIHFCYTAGIGGLPPPTKREWEHGGATQTCYLHRHVPPPWASLSLSLSGGCNTNSKLPPQQRPVPSWRIFAPPQPRLDLSRHYNHILAFGDSILEQLVSSSTSIVFGEKVALPLLKHTVPILLESLEQSLGRHLAGENCCRNDSGLVVQPKRVALVLNSALWNVLSDEATLECTDSSTNNDPWDNHLDALVEFLTQVLLRYGPVPSTCSEQDQSQRPHVTVYWMLPTAVHVHRVHLADSDAMRQRAPQKINRTRYMSASRTRQLYHRQRQVVEPLLTAQRHGETTNVEACSHGAADSHYFLDVYEATYLSADWTLPGDGRHYRPELNQKMLSWFL
jgi:hypothetical protein